MADYVSIANRVASRIGEDDQIRAPDQDSHVARTIAAVWNLTRQEAIRAHSWNMAMARAELAAEVTSDTLFPFAHAFRLPATCLRLIEVLNASNDAWQLESGRILANDPGPLFIRYLRDVEEPAEWDAGFTAYFTALLEMTVGVRIAGSNYDVARGERNAQRALSMAIGADARENPPEDPDLTGWERARMGLAQLPNMGPRW